MSREPEYRADGQEIVGHDWDNGPEEWDVIRNSIGEWIAMIAQFPASASGP